MLDAKNMQLLSEMCTNARTSTTQLAKAIGLSKESTHYRIKKLEKEYINGYFTIINSQHLNYKLYVWFVQLKNISATQEHAYVTDLEAHPNITYIGKLIGKWNVTFNVFAQNDAQLEEITKQITQNYKHFIENYTIIGTGIHEEVYTQKFFGEQLPHVQTTTNADATVDETDKAILRLLRNDARISYASLSEHITLSAPAIKDRIKRLEAQGTIQGYTVDLNLQALGFETYVIQLKTHGNTEVLREYLRTHQNVFFTYTYLGHANWDVDVGIFVKNIQDIRTFLIEVKEQFGEELHVHDMYIVADIIKENLLPEGVLQ